MALKAVSAPLGSPVGGSGTPGTIPVWSSGTTLTDSIVTQNAGTSALAIASATFGSSARLTLGGAANSTVKTSLLNGSTEVAFWQMNGATGEFRNSSGVSAGWGGFHTWYTDTTEKMRLAAAGNLTMSQNGTAAAPIIANSTGVSGLYFPTATTAAIAANGAVAATFSKVAGAGVALGGTTGLIFDASGTQQGVKLSATNGASSVYSSDPNTLDCYAEKDLTATMTPETSGTITLSSSTLKFTRIGRVVTIVGRLVIGSVSSPVGRLRINTGVGANEYPLVYGAGSAWLSNWLAGFTAAPQLLVVPGNAFVYLDRYLSGSVGIDCAAYAQAGSEVLISITYIL